MPTTRTTILKAIKTALLTIVGTHESRVRIGAFDPSKADGELRIMVWWRSDRGDRKDGNKSLRRLRLIVGVLGKVDRSSAAAETDLLQAGDLYDTIHAKLESIADTAIGGAYAGLTEVEPGIEPSGFDRDDASFWVGSQWELQYERARGAT